jgi:Outer membrane protein beta-barrel domain
MQPNHFRNYSKRIRTATLIAITLLTAEAALAQSSTSKVEVGTQLSIIDMRESIGEKPPGVGGRFTYNLTGQIAIDTEVTYFSTSEVDLNRTQALFGIRVGKRFASPSIGLFAKARPGFMRFHGEQLPGVTVDGTTKLALDLGGVIEFYPSDRFIMRIDVGDAIIFYNGETIRRLSIPGGPQQRLNTNHNLQSSVGIGFRF